MALVKILPRRSFCCLIKVTCTLILFQLSIEYIWITIETREDYGRYFFFFFIFWRSRVVIFKKCALTSFFFFFFFMQRCVPVIAIFVSVFKS